MLPSVWPLEILVGGGDEGYVCVYALLWVDFERVDVVVFNWYMCCGVVLKGVSTLGVVFHVLENLMW